MEVLYKGNYFPGRLEAVLDRSWEIEPVTWSQLTWWDPIPCGQLLVSQLHQEDLPYPFPSPALSMLTNPPTPHRRRKMAPTHLSFRSSSPSPIPMRRSSSYSASSPLAWPLPPSPDSIHSVFLPNSSPDYMASYSYPSSATLSPTLPSRSFTMSESMLRRASLLPTPPDSEEKMRKGFRSQRAQSYKVFNFPLPPPTLSPGLLPVPPPLLSRPPPIYR